MAYSGKTGIRRILMASLYSWQGLRAAFRHEEAFRQELLLAVLLIPLGIFLGGDGVEKVLLAGSAILLLIVELLNSAIEAAIDRIGSESHELSGRAKDMASAAVFLTVVLLITTWAIILIF